MCTFYRVFSAVEGRAGSLKDVLIDSCGSLTGIIFVRIFGYIGRKTIIEPLYQRLGTEQNNL